MDKLPIVLIEVREQEEAEDIELFQLEILQLREENSNLKKVCKDKDAYIKQKHAEVKYLKREIREWESEI